MFRILGWVGLVGLSILSTGCSIDSSLFGIKPPSGPFVQKTQGAEIVSGSTQFLPTGGMNPYMVNASAGNVYDRLEGSSSGGYKVFVTVQGQILSEEAQ